MGVKTPEQAYKDFKDCLKIKCRFGCDGVKKLEEEAKKWQRWLEKLTEAELQKLKDDEDYRNFLRGMGIKPPE